MRSSPHKSPNWLSKNKNLFCRISKQKQVRLTFTKWQPYVCLCMDINLTDISWAKVNLAHLTLQLMFAAYLNTFKNKSDCPVNSSVTVRLPTPKPP